MPKSASEAATYDKFLLTPVPAWLHAQIKADAAEELISMNDWMRGCALAKLRVKRRNATPEQRKAWKAMISRLNALTGNAEVV